MVIDEWVDKSISYGNTLNIKKMIGMDVLSKRGVRLGKIIEVNYHPQNLTCEGILIKKGLFGKKNYFSTKYIEKFSPEGVILSIEPTFLPKKKKVITSDGKVIGMVKYVERIDSTNQIKSIVLRKKLFRKRKVIPADNIKTLGVSIMLKESYLEKK